MKYSTRQAAKELGLHYTTFHKYLREKKIPLPAMSRIAGVRVRLWNESNIDRVRKLLPKIANGRKTRYQKLRKKQKAQPGAAVPRKTRKPKKK
jgi:predicted site-specific integrase-resolvase